MEKLEKRGLIFSMTGLIICSYVLVILLFGVKF